MKLLWILLLFTVITSGQSSTDHEEFAYVRHKIETSHSLHPKGGLVPDKDTAIGIAYSVALPVYGREELDREKPFRAELESGKWVVIGTLHKPSSGGTLVVQIDQSSGAISYLGHSM